MIFESVEQSIPTVNSVPEQVKLAQTGLDKCYKCRETSAVAPIGFEFERNLITLEPIVIQISNSSQSRLVYEIEANFSFLTALILHEKNEYCNRCHDHLNIIFESLDAKIDQYFK